jgi:hypothetical protein
MSIEQLDEFGFEVAPAMMFLLPLNVFSCHDSIFLSMAR